MVKLQISNRRNRRGAMMVFIAVLMVAFMFTVVFSIDLAYMHLARTELRSATDAAAKAGAQELAGTQSLNRARQKAQQIASANTVAGQPLTVDAGDIEFGRSVEDGSGKFVFRQNATPTNSVRINSDRSRSSAAGGVQLFFGGFTGLDTFEPEQTATSTFLERDVVLVVDRSGSMRGQKARDLINAIQIFVSTLNGTPVEEVVGLSSYSSFSTEEIQLTTGIGAINTAMNRMRFQGGTSISAGMDAGQRILNRGRNRDFVERTMIVMTDGRHNRGADPIGSASRLAANGVFIHTITFGSGADIGRMQNIARIGRGKHFHAANGSQLIQIYREIALTLSTMITK